MELIPFNKKNYKQVISSLRLARAGLSGHFRRNKKQINRDAICLDIRQFRRLIRAEKNKHAQCPPTEY